MVRRIDHVTFAGRDLDALRKAFETTGFDTVYGGTHSNGITHMALFGFEDHSYVELVSKTSGRRDSPWWNDEIDGDAGASAWAVPVDDIAEESERLADAGFVVDGPTQFSRERLDGTHVEWELTNVGEGSYGERYPMLIMDHTPLHRRAIVTLEEVESGLGGLDTVVVGTPNDSFERCTRRYEAFFRTEHSTTEAYPHLGVRVAHFDAAPVAVATPLARESWLSDRLNIHGTLPCAFLLDAIDMDVVNDRFEVANVTDWSGGAIHWFDVDTGGMFGAVEDN